LRISFDNDLRAGPHQVDERVNVPGQFGLAHVNGIRAHRRIITDLAVIGAFDTAYDRSVEDLDANGDLKMSVDSRSVYTTMIQEWMGYAGAKSVLKGEFAPLGVFA
jgi:hypothetical protein